MKKSLSLGASSEEFSRRSLSTTSPRSVVHTRRILSSTSFNCPLGHNMRIGLVSCPCFISFSSRTRRAQLRHLFREATRRLLLYNSRLSLSTRHRGCSREVLRPGGCRAGGRLSILDNSLCSVFELVFKTGGCQGSHTAT